VTRARFAVLLALATTVGACSAKDTVAPLADGTVRSESGRYTLNITPAAMIQRGENELRVESALPSGTRIDRVSAFMPAHGHGASSAEVSTEGSRTVIKRLMLTMPGKWQVEVDLSGPNQADLARFSIEVP
jgi:hypothetical protein